MLKTVARKVLPRSSTITATKSNISKTTVKEEWDYIEPSTDFWDYVWLLYGARGIGKTSLLSNFPDTIFLMFEPGGKALRIRRKSVSAWSEFLEKIDDIIANKPAKRVVLDTFDICYQQCLAHVCKYDLNVKHPTDRPYGKGWDAVNRELTLQLSRLASADIGIVFTSHAREAEVKKPDGVTYNVIQPTMSGQAMSFCDAVVDIVGYYYFSEGAKRRLQIRGTDFITAKCRPELNMIAKDGKPVFSIPMGDSSKEAYENILIAWNNEQETSGNIKAPTVIKTKRVMAK